jgi:hypothetical protein
LCFSFLGIIKYEGLHNLVCRVIDVILVIHFITIINIIDLTGDVWLVKIKGSVPFFNLKNTLLIGGLVALTVDLFYIGLGIRQLFLITFSTRRYIKIDKKGFYD